jgi:hypothetical protein
MVAEVIQLGSSEGSQLEHCWDLHKDFSSQDCCS